jgi:hypothetical protein
MSELVHLREIVMEAVGVIEILAADVEASKLSLSQIGAELQSLKSQQISSSVNGSSAAAQSNGVADVNSNSSTAESKRRIPLESVEPTDANEASSVDNSVHAATTVIPVVANSHALAAQAPLLRLHSQFRRGTFNVDASSIEIAMCDFGSDAAVEANSSQSSRIEQESEESGSRSSNSVSDSDSESDGECEISFTHVALLTPVLKLDFAQDFVALSPRASVDDNHDAAAAHDDNSDLSMELDNVEHAYASHFGDTVDDGGDIGDDEAAAEDDDAAAGDGGDNAPAIEQEEEIDDDNDDVVDDKPSELQQRNIRGMRNVAALSQIAAANGGARPSASVAAAETDDAVPSDPLSLEQRAELAVRRDARSVSCAS